MTDDPVQPTDATLRILERIQAAIVALTRRVEENSRTLADFGERLDHYGGRLDRQGERLDRHIVLLLQPSQP
jgi:hypothetical protein